VTTGSYRDYQVGGVIEIGAASFNEPSATLDAYRHARGASNVDDALRRSRNAL
jgi:hypothetical protein